jgi:hypothetical protein
VPNAAVNLRIDLLNPVSRTCCSVLAQGVKMCGTACDYDNIHLRAVCSDLIIR